MTAFWKELTTAQEAEVHGFEDSQVFEGCMPVEVMARRGHDTLLYGPLKSRGLDDPRTGRWPYAVVQLRRDNADGTVYNLVGFQTHLKFPEQRRVFSMIPALQERRISAVRRHAPEYVPGFSPAAGPVLPAEKGTPYCLCRTDDRRGGLRGVRRQWLPGGH